MVAPWRCTIPTHMATLYSIRYVLVSTRLHCLSCSSPKNIVVCAVPMTESRGNGMPPDYGVIPECGCISCHYSLFQWWGGAVSVCRTAPLATRIPIVPSLSMSSPRCMYPKETARFAPLRWMHHPYSWDNRLSHTVYGLSCSSIVTCEAPVRE